MRKTRLLLVIIMTILMLVMTGCTNNAVATTDEKTPDISADAEAPVAAESTPKDGSIDIRQVLTDTMFMGRDNNLYFEYVLTGDGDDTTMQIYYTPGFLRGDLAPDTDEHAVIVFNLTNDTAFMYMPALKFAGEYTNFPLFENITYQEDISEYADEITNLKRDTLNGMDVITGEVNMDEGYVQFWYSEEYGTMLKTIMDSPETGLTTYEVTEIDIPIAMDATLFEKPDGMTFYNLGDASDISLDDF